jgi:hypothetical protein
MSQFKPLITIELDEYNKLLNYMKTLEQMTSGDGPFKKALTDLVNGERGEHSLPPIGLLPIGEIPYLRSVLTKHKIKVIQINGRLELDV